MSAKKPQNKNKSTTDQNDQIDKVKNLAKITGEDVEVGYNASQQKKKKDDDRWHLSKWIVASYIAFTAIILVGLPIYNVLIHCLDYDDGRLDLVEILGQFNSVFGVPLGFVIGHYFKEK